jgi:DNA-binding MarR family transcriptional regulator
MAASPKCRPFIRVTVEPLELGRVVTLSTTETCRYNNGMKTPDEGQETSLPQTIESTAEEIARDCVAVRLRLLNRVITNVYDDALRPLGLKVSQMNILVVAARLGVAEPSQVCRMLQIDLSTLSRNLERLRARGWIESVPDRDARVHPFRVTRQGRELLEQAYPLWEKAQQRAIDLLGEDGVTLLAHVARRLTAERVEG